jgi:hypothetical protein
MPHRLPRIPSPVAASLLLALLGACSDPTTSNVPATPAPGPGSDAPAFAFGAPSVANPASLNLEAPTVIREVTNPVTGEKVKVNNGGYGSALAFAPWDPTRYYLMTDRGPNVAITVNGVTGIAFPVPEFHPQIGIFKRQGSQLKKVDVITLRDESCKPLSGLPLPAGQTGSTGEIAFGIDGTPLPFDPKGIDSEGLTILLDRSFWVSDEYGPFLTHFNSAGCTIERIGPGANRRSLPLALAKRRPNRGMEGLTSVLGGLYLVGMMQSPLDNPTAAGRVSRLTRLVVFNTLTGRTRQYAYLLDSPALANSEILALSPSRYLVLERDGNFPTEGPAAKRIYLIDVRGATDISDPANGERGLLVGGKSLEELTANASDPAALLATAHIKPITKTLAVDLTALFPNYVHDKVEGMALVDPWILAISNDDDFSVLDSPNGITQKILPNTTTVDFGQVVFVRLPFGIRFDDLEDIFR